MVQKIIFSILIIMSIAIIIILSIFFWTKYYDMDDVYDITYGIEIKNLDKQYIFFEVSNQNWEWLYIAETQLIISGGMKEKYIDCELDRQNLKQYDYGRYYIEASELKTVVETYSSKNNIDIQDVHFSFKVTSKNGTINSSKEISFTEFALAML